MTQKNKPNEIYISRRYEASVQMVWDAWTDHAQAAQWWGPRGYTLTTHSKELKVGGIWHYTMHGPDGVDYPNKAYYHEVVHLKKLVYDHGGYDDRPPLFRVTVTFQELNGQTQMEMTMTLPTAEQAEQTRKFIKMAGGNATWDRLAEYLIKDKETFFINRSFSTDIQTMYLMWTDPQHFSQWLPPTGMDMKLIRADFRVGGECFYSMSNGSSFTMFGKINYIEMEKPYKIVYTQCFTDESGKTTRAPFSSTWPEVMLATILFTEESENQTRVTAKWEIAKDSSDSEAQTFKKEKPGMTLGWTGSFDKLEELLLKK